MWVVKLGGSLWQSPDLLAWLDRLIACRQPVVVVPGGGPFADQVRIVQAHWRFDDRAAHVMALHAMEQMARMYCALRPACRVADSEEQIKRVYMQGGLPVWMPVSMVLQDSSVEADWSMTSDSLALWLANRLSANGVVLVKSTALPAPGVDLWRLQQLGIVDDCFEGYRRSLNCPVHIVNRAHADSWPTIAEPAAVAHTY